MSAMSWDELVEQWVTLASAGKSAASLPYARAAFDKALHEKSDTSLDYGNSLDYLGYSLHHTGQFTEAEQRFNAAVAHAKQYLGENHEDYITRLSNLAMLHLEIGEEALAVTELEKVIHLSEKNLEADNPYLGIMVNNLGLAYEDIGRYDLALQCYFRALDLTERSVGKDHERYGIRLQNIAAVYRKMEKPEKAIDLIRRAVEIYEKKYGRQHSVYLMGLNGLIMTYLDLKQENAARTACDTMLLLLDQVKNIEMTDRYDFLCTVAREYAESGRYETCLNLCKESLERYMPQLPRMYGRHIFFTSYAVLSLEKMGRTEEAARYILQLNNLILNRLFESFSKFSESEQLALHSSQNMRVNNRVLSFVAQHPDLPDMTAAAYDYEMNVKGASLSNRRQLVQFLREHSGTEIAPQFEAWTDLQNYLAKEYALPPARRQPGFDSLLNRAGELERSLAVRSEPFRLANRPANRRDVQAALKPGEAAIEFGQIRRLNPDSVLYYAWLIRPGDRQPLQVYLFNESEIGDLAAARRLYAYESGEGKTLRELLWKPLEPLLNGVSTVYFAPVGILNQINFSAIPLSATEQVFDRYHLHRMVSTRQLIERQHQNDESLPGSALIFGGIRYESDSSAPSDAKPATPKTVESRTRSAFFDGQWDFLAGSYEEADGVRKQLQNTGARVVFASGFDASEDFFKKNILRSGSPTVLHLATHGFFCTTPDSNARSGFEAAENPMARAGLALSGANRAWSGGETLAGQEDGILTALEISNLDLGETRLAVLSACGTGQGAIDASEGVLGLQRAFKMAGTQYIIMTLWNVNDVHAQQFMKYFYTSWLSGGKTIPEAFREAQQKMKAHYARPFQPKAWAGFVLLE